MNCADLLTKRANLTPEREAFYDLATGVRYTYAQLNERANRTANFLREKATMNSSGFSMYGE